MTQQKQLRRSFGVSSSSSFYIINTFYYCYSNKLPCLITDKSITNVNITRDINIVFNNKISNISWENLCLNNKFIAKKYKINNKFNISNSIFKDIDKLNQKLKEEKDEVKKDKLKENRNKLYRQKNMV